MPEPDPAAPAQPDFFLKVVCFELVLGLIAFLIGAILRYNPIESFLPGPATVASVSWLIALGVAAAMPLAGALLLLDRFPLGPFRELQDLTTRMILPLFKDLSVWQLFVVSAAAGFGEEILFRGLVQARLAESFPQTISLLAGSVLFGVCHWITRTYAVVATVMGLYLGILFIATDSLLVPIVTHAAYDFLALAYFLKWRAAKDGENAP